MYASASVQEVFSKAMTNAGCGDVPARNSAVLEVEQVYSKPKLA
jgi:hypothetical protein